MLIESRSQVVVNNENMVIKSVDAEFYFWSYPILDSGDLLGSHR
jgi:hypothetical protein